LIKIIYVRYASGQGVIQDNVTAHMWSNVGAANGNKVGVNNRDLAAKRMTPAAIEGAQRQARICIKSNYQDCD
jgi:uncharacterized protein